MLEEETESQGIGQCKRVELPDEQEIDRKMVELPEMPVRTVCEQEECVYEEICDISTKIV